MDELDTLDQGEDGQNTMVGWLREHDPDFYWAEKEEGGGGGLEGSRSAARWDGQTLFSFFLFPLSIVLCCSFIVIIVS